MGKASRDKGQRGMKEARRVLCEAFEVPHDVNRYPIGNQYTKGSLQSDLQGFPWAIEVKRQAKRLTPAEIQCAWEQACEKSVVTGKPPIVMERADKNPWWVWTRMLPLCADDLIPPNQPYRAMISFDDFVACELTDFRICDWRDEVCCG